MRDVNTHNTQKKDKQLRKPESLSFKAKNI